MPVFSRNSELQLSTCDIRLQNIMREVIKKIDCVVIQGHRNQEDQEKAFAEGKSKKHWPEGNHNSFPSRAMDVWPWTPEGKLDWKDVISAARLIGYIQRVAEEQSVRLRFGIDWDGDWRTPGIDPSEHFLDAPHMELVDP